MVAAQPLVSCRQLQAVALTQSLAPAIHAQGHTLLQHQQEGGGGSVLSTEATACQVAHATRGHQRHPPVTSAELPLSTKERLKRQEEGSMVGSVSPGVEGARGQRSTLNGPVEATCITHAKLVSGVLPASVPGSYAGSTRWLARTQGLASGPLQLSVLGTHAGSRPRLTSAGPGTYLAPI